MGYGTALCIYGAVDLHIIYDTLVKDIPVLKKSLEFAQGDGFV